LVRQADQALNSGDFNRVIDIYTKRIRMDGHSNQSLVKFYEFRGDAYKEIEQEEKAYLDYCEAIDIDPLNDSALAKRGIVLYIMDNTEEAYEDANQALDISPDNSNAAVVLENIKKL
jgi:tetratricopeptide (TPR) repeat protein